MLLIDGIKYELWTPASEDEFEQVVKEHAQEIFGENSLYFDRKQKLKSLSGIGSIPDGYVIVFGNSPEWHIVEIELSSHPLHDHIVAQVGKFVGGIKNPATQNGVTDAIYREITVDDFLKLRVQKAIAPTEIHKFLSDLISKPPIITIVIEKRTPELDEALNAINHPPKKVVEFQTFRRTGAEAVHAHLFEPLYQVVTTKVTIVSERGEDTLSPGPIPPTDKLEHVLTQRDLKMECFRIPKKSKLFSPSPLTEFDLITDVGVIKTNGRGRGALIIQKNVSQWFKAHHELKAQDKVRITVIEPMKKYRLEIVK